MGGSHRRPDAQQQRDANPPRRYGSDCAKHAAKQPSRRTRSAQWGSRTGSRSTNLAMPRLRKKRPKNPDARPDSARENREDGVPDVIRPHVNGGNLLPTTRTITARYLHDELGRELLESAFCTTHGIAQHLESDRNSTSNDKGRFRLQHFGYSETHHFREHPFYSVECRLFLQICPGMQQTIDDRVSSHSRRQGAADSRKGCGKSGQFRRIPAKNRHFHEKDASTRKAGISLSDAIPENLNPEGHDGSHYDGALRLLFCKRYTAQNPLLRPECVLSALSARSRSRPAD